MKEQCLTIFQRREMTHDQILLFYKPAEGAGAEDKKPWWELLSQEEMILAPLYQSPVL